jgi:hypothetical protein
VVLRCKGAKVQRNIGTKEHRYKGAKAQRYGMGWRSKELIINVALVKILFWLKPQSI